jgi:uncharacterized protein (TIGR01777 family)
MPVFESSTLLPVSHTRVAAWHGLPGAFERLAPTWQRLHVLERHGTIGEGDRLVFQLVLGPLRVRWEAVHASLPEGKGFLDRAVRSPFYHWEHAHRFVASDEGTCTLQDEVTWRLSRVPGVDTLAAPLVRSMLTRMFRQRHVRTLMDLTRHARMTSPPLRIAITGATGLVGTALDAFLTTGGHEVLPVLRRPPRLPRPHILWDPARGALRAADLDGIDAVIHLAGAGIADGRWTQARRREILESRTRSTHLLATTLAGMARPPEVLVSMSAVGWYGHQPVGLQTEDALAGEGFLAEVCAAWEAAAQPARDAGIRVVHPRLGVVLSGQGGALAKMVPPFLVGAGGPIGSGRQPMPWIALDDVVGGLLHMATTPTLHGPVNLVAPDTVTQAGFARVLGRVLGRPAFLPLPAAVVRMLFGEMGERALLEGAWASTDRLRDSGFEFAFATLEPALRFELGRLQG